GCGASQGAGAGGGQCAACAARGIFSEIGPSHSAANGAGGYGLCVSGRPTIRLAAPEYAMTSSPQLTVFTATVYPDVARMWYACVRRAFPASSTKFEIFYDSDGEGLPRDCFEGATFLRRTPERRDHHDAYNDAVQRATTPYLAIIDTDVFWTTSNLWDQVRSRLEQPGVAAVSCISRSRRKSHGTYAVVFKPEIYRKVLEELPGGFYPGAEFLDPKIHMTEWRWFDTGDILTQAVMEAGHKVELLHLDKSREVVRFYGVTLSRRGGRN